MRLRNNKPGTQAGIHRPDRIESYSVTASDATLLPFLLQSMPDRNRTTVKELLKNSQVAVNGEPTTQFNTELKPGDEVKVNLARPFIKFYNRRLKLVYEDSDLLVVNKGYGLLSMASDKITEGTAYSILREYVKFADPRNKLFIVHRLDRDTSGLMMFAKTAQAKDALQHNWNNMVLERTYVAVVDGNVEQDEGVVKSYLTENQRHEVYSTPEPVNRTSQLAVTRWKVIKRGQGRTMLAVNLDTGRKNQIRVHLKELGFPITGDRRYGGSTSPIHRLALHAKTLRFVHPATRQEMAFDSPIPAGFFKLV